MPSILNLKFKGNKSFVAFSNLADTDSLTSTWKVCTKVASYLEQGQRLENLSWRLWHLQNLMVDADNAKSKREFKKLSKHMGDKLDKEKGRSIEELQAPDFKRNHSSDLLRKRAAEKERSREASQNAKPGTIDRMQFTFSVDTPTPGVQTVPATKPDMKPSSEFKSHNSHKRARRLVDESDNTGSEIGADDPPLTKRGRKPDTIGSHSDPHNASVLFPSLFSDDFNPTALLYSTPSRQSSNGYGEGISGASDCFNISRPTIELPLDDILNGVDHSYGSESWASPFASNTPEFHPTHYFNQQVIPQDVTMQSVPEQIDPTSGARYVDFYRFSDSYNGSST